MKTKTMIKVLSVLFTITLFLTSCSTDQIESQEEIENTFTDTNNDSSFTNRGGAPSIMEVWVTYHPWVTQSEKDAVRNYYATAAGLITFDVIGDKEIWTVNEVIWNSYSNPNGSDDLGDEIESDDDVKQVEEQP